MRMDGDKNDKIRPEGQIDSQFPLVLQCSECNVIVGDSKSWVSANDDLKSITLKCVTDNVQIESKISVSSAGTDAGSTYRALKCSNCQNKLGIQYLATPPEFDQFRNCFTLDVKKINSYQVGSEGQASESCSDLLKCISIEDIYKEIRKVQILMVEFGQRILVLEEKLSVSYHSESQEGDTDATDNEQVLSTSKDHTSQTKRKLSTSGSSGPNKKSKAK